MPVAADNKHANRSAQTRERFILTAQRLFAERSIDSVSLNEITVAAGQKNRNALQYHFGDRDGLLQAIVDLHSQRVRELRQPLLDAVDTCANTDANTDSATATVAVRALLQPFIEYIEENPAGVYYFKILSQLAARSSTSLNLQKRSGLSFDNDKRLDSLIRTAVAHLQAEEAQRRLFLVVSLSFHGIADICGAVDSELTTHSLSQRSALFRQLVGAVESVLAAPPLEEVSADD